MDVSRGAASSRTSPAPIRVGIIGGGASGALVAARLLGADVPVDVTVFEPRTELGQGIAYGTADPLHVLNVPACGMSAFAEDADHFRRWADCQDTDFQPRAQYATYLRFVLDEALRHAHEGSSLLHVREKVTDVGVVPAPWAMGSDNIRREFDSIVLATGNDVPGLLPQIESVVLDSPRFVRDPWNPDAMSAIAPWEEVLLLGTGLTSVDVSLSIVSAVKGARIHAVSRHGLVPLAHEDPWRPRLPQPDLDTDHVDPRRVLAFVRSFGEDWRRGLDSLRPLSTDLWLGMDDDAKSAFLRHLSRYWDVHRHRMAPAVARAFSTLVDSGRVQVYQASVARVALVGERVETTFEDGRVLRTDRVVMCTGPSGDLRGDPLGALMMSRGVAQAGPTGSGYLVDPLTGALVNTAGVVDERVLTVGPPRRGVLWETTAMPEIRVQAADVAERILAALPARV